MVSQSRSSSDVHGSRAWSAPHGLSGGLLATNVGVLIFVLAHRGFRLIAALLVVILVGVIPWQAASEECRERMMTLTQVSEDCNIEAETGRIEVWKRGMVYFWERPVFGVGAGNFSAREGRRRLSQHRPGPWSSAHNAYVQAAADLGAIGALLFLALMASAARRAKRMWRARLAQRPPVSGGLMRPEMLASVSAASTAAVFLSMAYSWIIFMMVALVALADRVSMAESAGRFVDLR